MDRRMISEDEAQFFIDNGYLIVRGVIEGEELRRLQSALGILVQSSSQPVKDDPDFMYGIGHRSGTQVLRRIEYVIDKLDECKLLLGNPFVLRSAEKLIGHDLIPTWDAMVLKMPGEGIVVPWHRDAGTSAVGDRPIFNVDFYLDAADEQTCVWIIPGSHRWSASEINAWIAARPKDVVTLPEFVPEGAVPALMQPGDVLFHNILVLHGSPASEGLALRRVLYYEFRAAHVEAELGPHTPAYIPLKQKVLLACMDRRSKASYLAKEEPFRYAPPAPFDTVFLAPGETPPTFRYLHADYARPTAWTPAEMMKMRPISQVRVSPDGQRTAYVVSEFVMKEDRSERVSQIHITSEGSADSYQLTFGEKSSQDPQWAPDGNTIAFTSSRTDHGELYLIRANGGEAEALTHSKSDISAFAWSPDGTRIAFIRPDSKREDEEKADRSRNDARWVDENHKLSRLYLIHLRKDPGGNREARLLTSDDYQVNSFHWSPDGQRIVFSHQPTPTADDWPKSRVSFVDLESGKVTGLVESDEAAMQPCYSPDGRWIALTLSDLPISWATSNTIHVIPADGGEPQPLNATFGKQPDLIGWSADGRLIYFTEPKETTWQLFSIDVQNGAITQVTQGGVNLDFDLNSAHEVVGFVSQTSGQAPEAHVARLDTPGSRAVSRANADLPDLPTGDTEMIRWKSPDGTEIEGLLTYPVGYRAGSRVPLVLIVHGGPTGVYLQTFTAAPGIYPVAAFAARGYAVLRCNPRGSSGYGKAFRFANIDDWGGGDYADLMAGVDRVIEMGVADPDRMGVMGWSYGGYMTSWIITQTSRFRAASVGAAVTNLISFTGTADIPGFLPSYFNGYFWDRVETYLRHSPMLHVKGVTTPTLIQHGESDVRVPIGQGYELYQALKAQGVETRMLVLPRQPHGPTEPRMMLKTMQTNLDWFDEHLK